MPKRTRIKIKTEKTSSSPDSLSSGEHSTDTQQDFLIKIKDEKSSFSPDSLRSRKHPTVKREFVCAYDDCDKSYTSLVHLKRHCDTHLESIRCSEENCGKMFKTFSTLRKHIDNIHLKKIPKNYKCSFCDEEFNKHNWLTRHQFKHTGIKPYVCPKEGCEKRFLVPSKLKRHMKVHDGYTCSKENCGKTFPKWTLLTKHIVLSHPTIHKCQYCGKQFSRSNNLKAHIEIHKSNREVFECPKPGCSRFYTLKRNLDHHIRSFHDKRPFVCPQEHCYKAFKSEADMIAHKSRHDPNKRIRKKKKKGNPRPTFAARLAGFAPKKWQLQALKRQENSDVDTDNSDEENSDEENSDAVFEENSDFDGDKSDVNMQHDFDEDKSDVITPKLELCQDESEKYSANENISVQTSQDVPILTVDENSTSDEGMNNDIAMLLSMIEERKELGTLSQVKKTNCISVKV